jgi:hypothetical protein
MFIFFINADSQCTEPKVTTGKSVKEYYKYTGLINNKYPITMDCMIEDDTLKGNYHYDRDGTLLYITGIFDSNKFTFKTTEVDDLMHFSPENDDFEEIFFGEFISADTFAGTWLKKINGKKYPFFLKRTICPGVTPVVADVFYKTEKRDSLCYEWDSSSLLIEIPEIATATDSINRLVNKALYKKMLEIVNISQGSEIRFKSISDFQNKNDRWEYRFDEYRSYVEFNDKNILVIRIEYECFEYGSANSAFDTYFHNFDITTGKSIQLNDILTPGYNKRLLNILQQKLANTESYCYTDSDDCKEYFKNDVNFAIYPGGLRFQFFSYTLCGRSSGSVVLSYKEIDKLINKNGVLSRLVNSFENESTNNTQDSTNPKWRLLQNLEPRPVDITDSLCGPIGTNNPSRTKHIFIMPLQGPRCYELDRGPRSGVYSVLCANDSGCFLDTITILSRLETYGTDNGDQTVRVVSTKKSAGALLAMSGLPDLSFRPVKTWYINPNWVRGREISSMSTEGEKPERANIKCGVLGNATVIGKKIQSCYNDNDDCYPMAIQWSIRIGTGDWITFPSITLSIQAINWTAAKDVVLWIGDLDNDDKPDFLLAPIPGECRPLGLVELFLSSQQQSGNSWRSTAATFDRCSGSGDWAGDDVSCGE